MKTLPQTQGDSQGKQFSCLLPGKDKYTFVDICGDLCEQFQPWGCVFGAAHPTHPIQLLRPPGKPRSSSGRRHLPGGKPPPQPGPQAAPPTIHVPAWLVCSTKSVCLGAQVLHEPSSLLPTLGVDSFRQSQKRRFVVLTNWTFTSQSTHGPGRMLPIHIPASRWVRVSARSRAEALGLAPKHCSDHRLRELDRLCTCAQLLCLVLTLGNPMDSSLPGASVHGILQARILE